MISKLLGTSLICVGIFFAGRTHAASYTFTNLGSGYVANAINNAATVAGSAIDTNFKQSATLWSGNAFSPTSLAPLPSGNSIVANAINAAGLVAGSSTAIDGNTHAMLWNGATVTNLDNPASAWTSSAATAINGQNQVAGNANFSDGTQHAAMWTNGTAIDLHTLVDGMSSSASGINNAGIVVGSADVSDYKSHAVMWIGNTITDLGTDNYSSSAAAINAASLVVGSAKTKTDNFYHATTWSITSDGITNAVLGALAGSDASYANAVNKAGTVVGYSTSLEGPQSATLWNGTSVTDINSFLDAATVNAGWMLTSATGINDLGSIIGIAYNSISQKEDAFVLTVSAVPEPESYAMWLAGLCLIGSLTLRSRHRSRPIEIDRA